MQAAKSISLGLFRLAVFRVESLELTWNMTEEDSREEADMDVDQFAYDDCNHRSVGIVQATLVRQETDRTIIQAPSLTDETIVEDEDDVMIRHWKGSPFAVGLVKPSWKDERLGCLEMCRLLVAGRLWQTYFCTSCVCSRTGAGRVGNMTILVQRMEDVEAHNGPKRQRPRLLCVLGPYWPVAWGLTVPFFAAFGGWAVYSKVARLPMHILITWSLCYLGLVISFILVSCQDPGILYRHATIPSGQEESWRWNDQALTFRPTYAKYDTECAAVIEDFDHTCPWTGTAIGKKNMRAFRAFVIFALATIAYNVVILAWI